MSKPLTKQDIFEVVNNAIEKNNVNLLESINRSFSETEEKMATKADLAELKAATRADLAAMETRLVTKSYLDDKLSELRGDLMGVIKKEDSQTKTLVKILHHKKVISPTDAQTVLATGPFV